ncbi:MAG: hypothetical protein ACYCU5_14675 [Actinomycetes bacterium]
MECDEIGCEAMYPVADEPPAGWQSINVSDNINRMFCPAHAATMFPGTVAQARYPEKVVDLLTGDHEDEATAVGPSGQAWAQRVESLENLVTILRADLRAYGLKILVDENVVGGLKRQVDELRVRLTSLEMKDKLAEAARSAHVKDHGASGSALTTIGSIHRGSHLLRIEDPLDFRDGDRILIYGADQVGHGSHAIPRPLATVVLKGGGTRTLVVQTSAVRSVTGAVVKHDDGVSVRAALGLDVRLPGDPEA